MKQRRPTLFELWETHWPKIVAAVGATVVTIGAASLYLNLPKRVDAAEKNIEDLKGWAKEIQGYTRAINQQHQIAPQAPAEPAIQRLWDEHEGRYYCDDGQQTWWETAEDRCE